MCRSTFVCILSYSFKAERLQIYAYFHENFDIEIKLILYSNQEIAFYTLSMALITHVNYKEVKICKKMHLLR
jgi:hypothetical protein